MEKKNSRAIRHVEKQAAHNDAAAAYQLYKDHKKEGNEALADQYLNTCETILNDPATKLYLTRLQLIDFRRLNEFDMDFECQLTVVVGENGDGKTTITDGIVKTLSWLTSNLRKEDSPGWRIHQTDINVQSTQYAEINADFCLTKQNRYNIALSRAVDGAEEKKDGYVIEIKALADLYRAVNARRQINLPVFAFYSADRSRGNSSTFQEKLDDAARASRLDVYVDCLNADGSFLKFIKFYAQLDNRAFPIIRTSPEQIKEFEELEAAVHKIAEQGKLSYDNELWQHLERRRALIVQAAPDPTAVKHLQIVRQAILGMIPNATDLFVDRRPGHPELKITIKDVTVGVGLLSHGQKSVIAMVADMAWRLIMLNPKRDNPLEGQGIVIIDEIDLHLHPRWQQKILPKLLETFPGIQFIVTTHSPQVLTTVERHCIRILREIRDEFSGKLKIVASDAAMQTKGIASSDVLAGIMDIDPVPDEPEARELSHYLSLIEKNDYENDEATRLREKLIKHFGPRHQVMLECDRLIRLQEMKQKYSKQS